VFHCRPETVSPGQRPEVVGNTLPPPTPPPAAQCMATMVARLRLGRSAFPLHVAVRASGPRTFHTRQMRNITPGQIDKGVGKAGDHERSTSGFVASLMDDFIRIPGTDIRLGLDPILGLFPGLGDTVASLVGVVIINEAGRRGVSRKVLVAMALNILANAAVGAVPVAGDLFSFWFKSNRRNHDLLQKALSDQMSPAEREKAVRHASSFAVLLIAGVILGVVLIIIASIALLKLIIGWMSA